MLKKPLPISAESTARRVSGRASRVADGFSLLELLIVVGISITLASIAIPRFLNAYYNIRLKSAVSDLSGFMQRARIQAAKNNATYTIGYVAANGVQKAYIDLNVNGQYDAGEPLLTFNSSIAPAAGVPATPYVLVGDTAGVTYTNATTLGYSPRGLPCAYAAGVCSTPAAGYFVYYFTDQRPGSVGWGAVVVTRAGRTKTVTWNGVAWQ
jgi:Tfp pilus assembly protein FimT